MSPFVQVPPLRGNSDRPALLAPCRSSFRLPKLLFQLLWHCEHMVPTTMHYVHTSSFDHSYPRKLATLEILIPECARIGSHSMRYASLLSKDSACVCASCPHHFVAAFANRRGHPSTTKLVGVYGYLTRYAQPRSES